MTKAKPVLSQSTVHRARGREQPYEVTDGAVRGLRLRVQPSGIKTYYLDWPKRFGMTGTRIKIGRTSAYTLADARNEARRLQRELEASRRGTPAPHASAGGTKRQAIDQLRALRKDIAALLTRVDAYTRMLRRSYRDVACQGQRILTQCTHHGEYDVRANSPL